MTETKRAFIVAWLILSIAAAAVLSAFFVLPESTVLGLSRRGRLPSHGDSSCPFCGMTRAFLAISSGQLRHAASLNRGAVPLLGGLVLNEAFAAFYLAMRIKTAYGHALRARAFVGNGHK